MAGGLGEILRQLRLHPGIPQGLKGAVARRQPSVLGQEEGNHRSLATCQVELQLSQVNMVTRTGVPLAPS